MLGEIQKRLGRDTFRESWRALGERKQEPVSATREGFKKNADSLESTFYGFYSSAIWETLE